MAVLVNLDPCDTRERRVKHEGSGIICECGSRYGFTLYEDDRIRYEVTQFIDGKHLMLEWHEVGTADEMWLALEAYNAAWHGARH